MACSDGHWTAIGYPPEAELEYVDGVLVVKSQEPGRLDRDLVEFIKEQRQERDRQIVWELVKVSLDVADYYWVVIDRVTRYGLGEWCDIQCGDCPDWFEGGGRSCFDV